MPSIVISTILFGRRLKKLVLQKVKNLNNISRITEKIVEAIADLIGEKSGEIAQRCIQDDYLNNDGTQKLKPRLKEDVYEDAECGRFIMHGPTMTKVLILACKFVDTETRLHNDT